MREEDPPPQDGYGCGTGTARDQVACPGLLYRSPRWLDVWHPIRPAPCRRAQVSCGNNLPLHVKDAERDYKPNYPAGTAVARGRSVARGCGVHQPPH